MIHSVTRNSAYNYSITYESPQSKLKEWDGTKVLTEKNDADNDVYRNAATKATMIAEDARYSQGTFDLAMLIGGNANSYFTGNLSSATDVDYFHLDTMSQCLNRRPVIIDMKMPEGADYDLTVYDNKGNQVGMAVKNEDGTKTLTVPCDWSNCHKFVIKVSQNSSNACVESSYKLTFSQGEMPQEVKDALKRMKSGKAELRDGSLEERALLADNLKEKNNARNAEEIMKLHQAQYSALLEELQYKGNFSAEELLEKELHGEHITEAEKKYIAIYGNQNAIYKVECQKRKQALEQEFITYLEAVGLSGKEFSFHLKTGGKTVVSGLDEAKKEQVEDYIEAHWERFKSVYLAASKECAEMTDQEYRIAGYVEECNQFLANVSGGKVTVDNLSLERKVAGWYINHENIVGLPPAIANALNSAESTDKYYDYKQMLHNILNYKQEHGEIPQYHMNFNWSGKELQC